MINEVSGMVSTKAGLKWVQERVRDKLVTRSIDASEGYNKEKRNGAIVWENVG